VEKYGREREAADDSIKRRKKKREEICLPDNLPFGPGAGHLNFSTQFT
jgi:hypothetical protein